MGLTVENLTKRFGEKTAIHHLNFVMEEPGVFGLLGTNGAGKTTTIRSILGIMQPDEGKALWNGKKITRDTLAFGYLPEERGIYMKAKVLEQLIYFGHAQRHEESRGETIGAGTYGTASGDRVPEHAGRKAVKGKSAEDSADCSYYTQTAVDFSG